MFWWCEIPIRNWKSAINHFAILFENSKPIPVECRLHEIFYTPVAEEKAVNVYISVNS